MIIEIKIKPKSFESKILWFKSIKKIEKINILFGGNGTGKTTLLKGIINKTIDLISDNEIFIMKYVNGEDNSRAMKNNSKFGLDLIDLVIMSDSQKFSEGQSIVFHIMTFLSSVEFKCKSSNETVVAVIDEMDSGLSSENINVIIHRILEICNENKNVQFFISSNHYHFVYIFKKVISMYNGKKIEICNYTQFYNILSEGMKKIAETRDLSFLEAIHREESKQKFKIGRIEKTNQSKNRLSRTFKK
jgi:ABC-type multidrug transport system ATPase subunit